MDRVDFRFSGNPPVKEIYITISVRKPENRKAVNQLPLFDALSTVDLREHNASGR
jgi:hypothetical protein